METQSMVNDLARTILERIGTGAGTQMVFGTPQQEGGRTIIPVAEVFYRFGLGMGGGSGTSPDQTSQGSGGGGGAGGNVRSHPIGYIEITGDESHFVPALDVTRIVISGLLSLVVIVFLATRAQERMRR